jgi:hypothetical protein
MQWWKLLDATLPETKVRAEMNMARQAERQATKRKARAYEDTNPSVSHKIMLIPNDDA